MITPLDPILLCYRRDLARANAHGLNHYVRLYREDRLAFFQELQRARRMSTAEPFVTLCEVLEANCDLRRKEINRYISRLNTAERFDEAERLLRDLGRSDVVHLHQHAIALAGVGRWLEAQALAERALELQPSSEAIQSLVDGLFWVRKTHKALTSTSPWPAYRRLIDSHLRLGAAAPAMRALRRFCAAQIKADGEELADLHLALDTILSLLPPANHYDLFRALERFYRDDDRAHDLAFIHEDLYVAGARDKVAGEPAPFRSEWLPLQRSWALARAAEGRQRAAIEALGDLTLRFPKDNLSRYALARLIGQDHKPMVYRADGPRPRVFDVFIFNDEVRVLKLKLEAMAPFVDRFVLVEARQTFTGEPKPLHFEAAKAEFAEFAQKIVHIVVDEFPPWIRSPWAREFFQRDAGLRGLSGRCAPEDIVLISDADEVVAPSVIKEFGGEYAWLRMERARYFLNYRMALPREEQRGATSIWRARYFNRLGLSYARVVLGHLKKIQNIFDAGWHFTSIGGADIIHRKLQLSAHQEFSSISQGAIAGEIERIRAGEAEPEWERCEIDERFPKALRDNIGAYADVIL